MSPPVRANLTIALFPLGVALIARALGTVEALIAERTKILGGIEQAIVTRAQELAAMEAAIAPLHADPAPARNGAKLAEAMADIRMESSRIGCIAPDCPRQAITESWTCAEHADWVPAPVIAEPL